MNKELKVEDKEFIKQTEKGMKKLGMAYLKINLTKKQKKQKPKIIQIRQKYDYLVQKFLRGRSTRKEEKELINILLNGFNGLLGVKRDIENKLKRSGEIND